LTKQGKFVSFETPKEPLRALLPLVNRTSNVKPHSGIDNFEYAFEFVPPFDQQGGTGQKHEAFCGMLASLDLPVPTALLRFLQRPDRPLFLPLGIDASQMETLLAMPLTRPEKKWENLLKGVLIPRV